MPSEVIDVARQTDPDPELLLPANLRDIPGDATYQYVLVGAIVGAGTALGVAGFVMETAVLEWGFPVALRTRGAA